MVRKLQNYLFGSIKFPHTTYMYAGLLCNILSWIPTSADTMHYLGNSPNAPNNTPSYTTLLPLSLPLPLPDQAVKLTW